MSAPLQKRRWIGSLLAVGMAAAIATTAADAHAAAYKAPFNVAIQRETHGLLDLSRDCAQPPPPIVALQLTGAGADKQARKLLARYQRKLNEITDDYVRSKPANQLLAQCALNWLAAWARAGALLGETDAAGAFVRKKTVGPIALAFLKLDDGAVPGAGERAVVSEWLGNLGQVIRAEYSTDAKASSRRNFHLHEAAMSVVAAGIAAGDSELFDWGMDRARFALSRVPDDGWFQWALGRGDSALRLQLQSIGPLVLVAEMAAANGIDLYEAENRALHRVVRAAVNGYRDPSLASGRVGARQSGIGDLDPQSIAWLTIYAARFPTAAAELKLRAPTASNSELLGGDLELLYVDANNQRAVIDPPTVDRPARETSK